MRSHDRKMLAALMLTSLCLASTSVFAGAPRAKSSNGAKIVVDRAPDTVDLLAAARAGTIDVIAQGRDDGRISLSVTNRGNVPLKVVLPAGLIASGATGQFAGMGGVGGGIGGIGGLGGAGGGGFGGMNNGFGGGGGMNGFGGGGMNNGFGGGMNNRGGMGAGMGGFNSGGTLPASVGMMMVGRLIMNLSGERNSWSFVSSMPMGNGGGMNNGFGGGGGGMNGFGGGMNNGFGNGFRSVPPTSLPFTTIAPGQTHELPTRVISLDPPRNDATSVVPAPGEILKLDAPSQSHISSLTTSAVEALANAKAPGTIAQLVTWNVANEVEWSTIARLSKGWANTHELTLAKTFAESLGSREASAMKPRMYYEVSTKSGDDADKLEAVLNDHVFFGLKTGKTIPGRPMIPAIACRIKLDGTSAKVTLLQSDADAADWITRGEFSFKRGENGWDGDTLAREILDRLVTAKVVAGPKVKGKPTYRLEIVNSSPLVLNSVVFGVENDEAKRPSIFPAVGLSPQRKLVLPITNQTPRETRVLAAELSAL